MKQIKCNCGYEIHYSRGDINKRYIRVDDREILSKDCVFCPKCKRRVDIRNESKKKEC
jgi:hypothetical protein